MSTHEVSLKRALELGGQNLLNCLCPRRNYLPYWNLDVDRVNRAEFKSWWTAHNVGRWWDAMLRVEKSIGFVIPAQLEGAMLQNVQRFFDNADHLPSAPADMPEVETRSELHSLREGLLALHALARFRHSRWAAAEGHLMLESVRRALKPDNSWDLNQFGYWHGSRTELDWGDKDLTLSHGRLIEALVPFYQATGDDLALELADRLSRHHLQHSVAADGTIPEQAGLIHTHSWLGTLRGLLLYGELSGQHEYIDAVEATYRVTVRRMVKESGFIAHDFGHDRGGETASPGDAAQIALWLALRHGYTEYLDDAERIVRARILPSQITERPGLVPTVDDGRDEHLNLDERVVGGFGGMHREPHAGKQNVTDVTASGVHTLCDIYDHIVTQQAAGLAINFHFDYADEQVQISSRRGDAATVSIMVAARCPLLIRVPRWTPQETVRLSVNGVSVAPLMLGDYARIAAQDEPAQIVLSYGLPAHNSVETTDGVAYHFAWRGDEVTGISPNSSYFPFYPTAEAAG